MDIEEAASQPAKTSFLDWGLPALVFAAPVLVVLAGNWVLNETIEINAISYDFFYGAPLTPDGMHSIPAKVIEALYSAGFALCATFTLALMLTVYASVIVWQALGRTGWASGLRIGYIIALLAVLGVSSFRMPETCEGLWPRLDRKNLPTDIAYNLIERTISDLPICRKGATDGSVICEKEKEEKKPFDGLETDRCLMEPDDGVYSIGSTGHSLGRIAVLAYGLIAVAGVAYVFAVTALAAEPLPVPEPATPAPPRPVPDAVPVPPTPEAAAEPDLDPDALEPPVPAEGGKVPPDPTQAKSEADKALSQLDSLSMLAAITFVVTIVAVGLLFLPGYEMILSAHIFGKSAEELPTLEKLPLLQDYHALSNALRTCWATLFSLALATAHFGAAICLKVRNGKDVDLAGMGAAIKAVLLVLSPTLADVALKISGGLAGLTP